MTLVFGLNKVMLDHELETSIHDIILDLCEVLYCRGFDTASIGAIMRLIGVPEEKAKKHDNEYFALDEEFLSHLDLKQKNNLNTKVPLGVTIH